MYDSIMVAGNAVRIMLTHIGTGLVAKGGDLKTFPIAGKDGKFVQATARIDRPDIVDPASVRYAWEYYPEDCNLYNGDGLPAAPFRTDKW